MILETIMSKHVVTVGLDDSLREIKKIFDNGKIHHLLVEEKGQLYGVISDRDLWRAISPYLGTAFESTRDAATLNKRAHHIMTRKPISLYKEADIFECHQHFQQAQDFLHSHRDQRGSYRWHHHLARYFPPAGRESPGSGRCAELSRYGRRQHAAR